MSLSREEYLTVKDKLEYYIYNRLVYVDLVRKEKDKNKKEEFRNTVALLNKITTGIISYQLTEELTIEQHLLNIEEQYLKLIKTEFYIDPNTVVDSNEEIKNS